MIIRPLVRYECDFTDLLTVLISEGWCRGWEATATMARKLKETGQRLLTAQCTQMYNGLNVV